MARWHAKQYVTTPAPVAVQPQTQPRRPGGASPMINPVRMLRGHFYKVRGIDGAARVLAAHEVLYILDGAPEGAYYIGRMGSSDGNTTSVVVGFKHRVLATLEVLGMVSPWLQRDPRVTFALACAARLR